jgi:hypothetical protein
MGLYIMDKTRLDEHEEIEISTIFVIIIHGIQHTAFTSLNSYHPGLPHGRTLTVLHICMDILTTGPRQTGAFRVRNRGNRACTTDRAFFWSHAEEVGWAWKSPVGDNHGTKVDR